MNWVRAFEAAARHEGFASAADELGVSAGAISQHVRQLECRLGVTLFERHPRGVRLTDTGRTYRDALGPALDAIASASRRAGEQRGNRTLRLVALPAIAQMWLTPRLSSFRAAAPGIAVQLETAERIEAGGSPDFDVAIHYESQAAPGLEAMPLFRDELFPVCTRELARSLRLREPSDLGRCRLLYDTRWSGDWARWCAAAGLPAPDLGSGLGFSLYSMAVAAAVDGQGLLVAHRALVSRELASGRLIEPFSARVPAPHRYVALFDEMAGRRAPVGACLRWLHSEVTA